MLHTDDSGSPGDTHRALDPRKGGKEEIHLNGTIGRGHGRRQDKRALYADVARDPFPLKAPVTRAFPGKHRRSIQSISDFFSHFHQYSRIAGREPLPGARLKSHHKREAHDRHSPPNGQWARRPSLPCVTLYLSSYVTTVPSWQDTTARPAREGVKKQQPRQR